MTDCGIYALNYNVYRVWLENNLKTNQFQEGLSKYWFEGDNFIMFYFHTGSSKDKKKKDGSKVLNYTTFSNFHPIKINAGILGDKFKDIDTFSTEHLFQAAKYTQNNPEYAKKILLTPTAWDAAQMGRDRKIPGYDPDWDKKKFGIMLDIVREKAKICKEFKDELLSTSNKTLIENTNNARSGDAIWGCGKDGKGMNYLGLVLMIVRDEIKDK